jgi:hypothetical protein
VFYASAEPALGVPGAIRDAEGLVGRDARPVDRSYFAAATVDDERGKA